MVWSVSWDHNRPAGREFCSPCSGSGREATGATSYILGVKRIHQFEDMRFIVVVETMLNKKFPEVSIKNTERHGNGDRKKIV